MKPSNNLFMLSGKITFLSFKKSRTGEEMFVMGLSVPYRSQSIPRGGRIAANQLSISGFKGIVGYAKKHLQKQDYVTLGGEITSSAVKGDGKKKFVGMKIWLVARTIQPNFRGSETMPHPMISEPWLREQHRDWDKPPDAKDDPLMADDFS